MHDVGRVNSWVARGKSEEQNHFERSGSKSDGFTRWEYESIGELERLVDLISQTWGCKQAKWKACSSTLRNYNRQIKIAWKDLWSVWLKRSFAWLVEATDRPPNRAVGNWSLKSKKPWTGPRRGVAQYVAVTWRRKEGFSSLKCWTESQPDEDVRRRKESA